MNGAKREKPTLGLRCVVWSHRGRRQRARHQGWPSRLRGQKRSAPIYLCTDIAPVERSNPPAPLACLFRCGSARPSSAGVSVRLKSLHVVLGGRCRARGLRRTASGCQALVSAACAPSSRVSAHTPLDRAIVFYQATVLGWREPALCISAAVTASRNTASKASHSETYECRSAMNSVQPETQSRIGLYPVHQAPGARRKRCTHSDQQ